MGEPLFVVIMGVLFVAIFAASHYWKKRQIEAWRAFAEARGLTLTEGSWTTHPSMAGSYGGVRVEIEEVVRGSGKHKTTYTVARGYFDRAMPSGLHVSPEGLLDRVAKLFGGQDIQLGDPFADKALRIKGDTPQQVIDLLKDTTTLDAVMRFIGGQPGSREITAERAELTARGMITDEPTLTSLLDEVSRLVKDTGPRRIAQAEGPRLPRATKPPPPLPRPPTSAPPPPPVRAAPAPEARPTDERPLDVTRLLRLKDPELSTFERETLGASFAHRRIAATMAFGRITLTVESGLPEALRGGDTVVGTLEGGVGVAVVFPASEHGRLRQLTSGAPLALSGTVQRYDTFLEQLVVLSDA